MALKHVMINDIITEQTDRMQNLKKYYPFFVLYENTFSQYKDGRYAHLDMGYITLASLRFFINENNFNERDITYEEYEAFLTELLVRDFDIDGSDEESAETERKELVLYIFDKIKNDGKAFEFKFFDPGTRERKVTRVKILESTVRNSQVYYHVTPDAIEFYLDTKEAKDESKINVEQLLLEKMITSNNFRGGIDVVRRINNEVVKLILEKEQVIKLLSIDVYEGAKACENFMSKTSKWFSEEQKQFAKNKNLVEKAVLRESALAKAGENSILDDTRTGTSESAKSHTLLEISELETELKKTIYNHSELISETAKLAQLSDQIISRAKLKKLRPVFDFNSVLNQIFREDRPDKMAHILLPLFEPKTYKTFSMTSIDNILSLKGDDRLKGEKIEKEIVDLDYEYEDEKIDKIVGKNFARLFGELLERLAKWDKLSIKEFNAILEIKYGEELYKNRDYFAFLANLAGKRNYDMKAMYIKQDTVLEEMVVRYLDKDIRDKYPDMKLELEFTDEIIKLCDAANKDADLSEVNYVTDIIIRRTDI